MINQSRRHMRTQAAINVPHRRDFQTHQFFRVYAWQRISCATEHELHDASQVISAPVHSKHVFSDVGTAKPVQTFTVKSSTLPQLDGSHTVHSNLTALAHTAQQDCLNFTRGLEQGFGSHRLLGSLALPRSTSESFSSVYAL